MSGHSKWATIKHKKGATDAKRAKVFAKLIRQVEVAAREGGGDVEMNPTLRTMYQKARDASVPVDTIERAIKRATGDLEGVRYEAVNYEGYAPLGVAIVSWGLALYFTAKRRMALPSILLLLAFVGGVFSTTVFALILGVGPDNVDGNDTLGGILFNVQGYWHELLAKEDDVAHE